MRRPDERDLRAALRDEADRHRPDREAMLNRIAQGRSAPARRPIDRLLVLLRPVAAAVAVAVVLVLAVAGVRLSSRSPDVDDKQVAAPTPTAAPATTTTTTAPEPSATPSRAPRTSPARTVPADPGRDDYLTSTGRLDPHSNDGWSQQNVELETGRTLTAVEVTVTVARTAGVAETGRWTTVPTHMVTMTSTRTGKNLVYRFVLKPEFTLAPGRYTFAVQFNHGAGKRPMAADSYRAVVTGGGERAKVNGGFRAP